MQNYEIIPHNSDLKCFYSTAVTIVIGVPNNVPKTVSLTSQIFGTSFENIKPKFHVLYIIV